MRLILDSDPYPKNWLLLFGLNMDGSNPLPPNICKSSHPKFQHCRLFTSASAIKWYPFGWKHELKSTIWSMHISVFVLLLIPIRFLPDVSFQHESKTFFDDRTTKDMIWEFGVSRVNLADAFSSMLVPVLMHFLACLFSVGFSSCPSLLNLFLFVWR